jgi:hypothetical protein
MIKTYGERQALEDVNNDDLIATAAQCIDAFFAEVKHNASIVDADIDFLAAGVSVDDLCEFIQSNKALKNVTGAKHCFIWCDWQCTVENLLYY